MKLLAASLFSLTSVAGLTPCASAFAKRPVVSVVATAMNDRNAVAREPAAADNIQGAEHTKVAARARLAVPVVNGTSCSKRRRRGNQSGSKKRRGRVENAASLANQRRSPLKLMVSLLKPLGQAFLVPWKVRLVLRETWSAAHQGVADKSSVDFSIVRSSNDFELVTRAGKELEHVLEAYFEAPPGKAVPLPVKIRCARTAKGEPLRLDLQKRMKHLIRTRNALVHKRDVSEIRHRRDFQVALEEVLRELAVEADRVRLRRRTDSKVSLPPDRNATRFVILTDFVAQLPLARMPVSIPVPVRLKVGVPVRRPQQRPAGRRAVASTEDIYRA